MIDEKKLAELRVAWQRLDANGMSDIGTSVLEDLADTLSAIWKENAQLKAANAALQKTLLSGIPDVQNALARMIKLEAVARAAEVLIGKMGLLEINSGVFLSRADYQDLIDVLVALKEPC